MGDRRIEALHVESLGAGAFRVSDDRRTRLAYAAGPTAARWVFIEGRTYIVNATAGGPAIARRPDEDTLSSPMPATVARINVIAGQPVARGDVLVVLEAMKMEFAVHAPRDGTIRRVACRQGDLVQPSVPLVELE